VRMAAWLRTRCERLIRESAFPGWHPHDNGEEWLAQTMAGRLSTYVDVGAHRGDLASMYLRESEPPRALLFEPAASAYACLDARFGRFKHVRLIQAAVSDHVGTMPFYETPDLGETSTLVAGARRRGATTKSVAVTTLDSELSRHDWDKIGFLKIDTEGYDLRVLRGAAGLLSQQRIDLLQFEYNTMWQFDGSTLCAAHALLTGSGYRVFLLKGPSLYELTSQSYERYGEYFYYSNYLAISPRCMGDFLPHVRGLF
jgi:FkbM family methyltransferase